MIIITVIIGALIGTAVLQNAGGLVIGATIGFLVAEIVTLRSRVKKLELTIGQEATAESGARPETVQAPRTAPPAAAPAATEAAQVAPPPAAPPSPAVPATTGHEASMQPRRPRIVDDTIALVRNFFTGGNTVARVGVVVLFFGIAFLLKYAAEHARLPVELRLAGVAIGAVALLFVGARLRRKREGYGLTLEGGAIGILSLTIFAAFRLYNLLPAPLAFALLVVTFAACVTLALTQNSLALAALGVSGGFLAPVLASTGAGSHVALFSYYALLNGAILFIAWFKAWRWLNLLGFAFTFVIGSTWGYRYYRPEFFGTTEPFLILFFVFYLIVAILFARRQPPELRSPVDGTLVFGVPIVAFVLQAALVKDYEYGLAWSAFSLGAIYVALAWFVFSRGYARLLAQAFLALGVIFATLTIPLAVNGYWTTAAWAIEGAGILWLGLRQSRTLPQVFGLLVQFGAGVFFFVETKTPGGIAVFNSAFTGIVLLSAAGMVSGYLLHRYRDRTTRIPGNVLAYVLLAWGLLWWYGGTLNEIRHHVSSGYRTPAWLALIAATTLAQHFAGARLAWPALRFAVLFNLAALYIALLWASLTLRHPFANAGVVAWSLALGAYYFALKHVQRVNAVAETAVHVGTFWLLAIVLGWELHWQVAQILPRGDWAGAAVGIFLAALLLVPLASQPRYWPVRDHVRAYVLIGAIPVLVLALAWIVIDGVFKSGNPAPLPYVPLLNPLDIGAMFVVLALTMWLYRTRRFIEFPPEGTVAALGLVVFVWLNAVLFRTLHHFAGIRYTLAAMHSSTLAQAAVSIFWTALAFVLMLVAKRSQSRQLWVAGAALLGVVVVKLFIVDLSGTGTVARIVSFVGVGALLLIIGYLVPVPPRTPTGKEAHS